MNHLFHFPLAAAGAASLGSLVSEGDDNEKNSSNNGGSSNQELNMEVLKAANAQFLSVGKRALASFVELHDGEQVSGLYLRVILYFVI